MVVSRERGEVGGHGDGISCDLSMTARPKSPDLTSRALNGPIGSSKFHCHPSTGSSACLVALYVAKLAFTVRTKA